MGLRTLASGCPNCTKIDRISMENKLLEVAKYVRKSFDKKSEFCFHMLPSVFTFRCQEFTVNQLHLDQEISSTFSPWHQCLSLSVLRFLNIHWANMYLDFSMNSIIVGMLLLVCIFVQWC